MRTKLDKNMVIKIGRYYTYNGVPCIELIVPDMYDDKEETVYLSAFRRYAFQISGTKIGSWDLGSTPVFGLGTFRSIQQIGPSNLSQVTTVKYIIHCVAMDALRNYCNNAYGQDLIMPAVGYKSSCENNDEWNKFIDNVYLFSNGEEIEEVELPEAAEVTA